MLFNVYYELSRDFMHLSTPEVDSKHRLKALDGWRAISILLILVTHMVPLSPRSWDIPINKCTGNIGMSLFFILSGFLITSNLYLRGDTVTFFIRRLFRILPLAWLYLLIVLPFLTSDLATWVAHLSFSVNYFPSLFFDPVTLHFWSLCVELHFYLFIGLMFALFGKKSLYALPLLWATASIRTILFLPTVSDEWMTTHIRIDEILAGCTLALIHLDPHAQRIRQIIARIPLLLLVPLVCVASWTRFWDFYWLRGIAAMLLIGHTLYLDRPWISKALESAFLFVIAELSYALYVLHPITMIGWLGSGDTLVRYLKRPLCIALTFALAYLSTHYFEARFIALGKTLAGRFVKKERPSATDGQQLQL